MSMWTSAHLSFSILVGCLIKVGVTKYGGAKLYQKLKPLMIGVIAGEMMGMVIPIIIGTAYYIITGKPPVEYTILPL